MRRAIKSCHVKTLFVLHSEVIALKLALKSSGLELKMTVELSVAEAQGHSTVNDMLQLSEANAKRQQLETIVANVSHDMARASHDFERRVLEDLADLKMTVDRAKKECEDKYK